MSPSGKAPESLTQVFVTVKDKKLLNDRLFLNVDAVALKDGRVVPHQKVFFEVNGERKAVDLPATGVLKEHDLVFKDIDEVRVMLNAWAEGSEIMKIEQDIVVKNEEVETEEEQEEPLSYDELLEMQDSLLNKTDGRRLLCSEQRQLAEIEERMAAAALKAIRQLHY